jgi:hypothetical protein
MKSTPFRSRFVFSLLMVTLSVAFSPVWASQYGQRIVYPSSPGTLLLDSVRDGVRVLGTMTGNTFTSVVGNATASQGIILALTNSPGVPAAVSTSVVALNSDEGYGIVAVDTNNLLIVSTTRLGLSRGLYRYLDSLGVRWYQPGQRFEVIPQQNNLLWSGPNPTYEAPLLRTRSVFAQGGFGIATPVDTNLSARADFNAFLRRNRLGGDLLLNGHDWDAFVRRNTNFFLPNPGYVCGTLLTSNGAISPSVKLCVSNTNVLDRYAQDRLAYFNQYPQVKDATVVPSDGLGFCNPQSVCGNVGDGSPSDQTFYLANEVARRVAQVKPDKLLNSLAYSVHTAPPSFGIESNVFVLVAGAGFQTTYYTPQEILCQWTDKMQGRNLGYYDYWALPQGNRDFPTFRFLELPEYRLQNWDAASVDAFQLETTAGGGAIGPALWYAARHAWGQLPLTHHWSLDYFREMYGLLHTAEGFGGAFLEYWARNFELAPHVIGAMCVGLDNLLNKPLFQDLTPAQRQRVLDYANYVQYLRLCYEYRRLPKGNPQRSAKARETVKWLWRIHDSRLVHTYWIQHLIRNTDERGEPWIADFDLQNPNAPGWAEVLQAGPPSEAETRNNLLTAISAYGSQALEPNEYGSLLAPLNPNAQPNYPVRRFSTSGTTRFVVWVPTGTTGLVVRAHNHSVTNDPSFDVRMKWYQDEDTSFGCTDPALVDVVLTDVATDYYLPTPEPGLYELVFVNMKGAAFNVKLPPVPVSATRFEPNQTMDLYVYVPTGVDRFLFKSSTHSSTALAVWNPSGQQRPFVREQVHNDNFFTVPVGANESGVWRISGYKNSGVFRLINIPQAVSFQPDGLVLPDNY